MASDRNRKYQGHGAETWLAEWQHWKKKKKKKMQGKNSQGWSLGPRTMKRQEGMRNRK